MKTNKTILTTAVVTAITGSAFATIPSNIPTVYNNNNSVVAVSSGATAIGDSITSSSQKFVAVGNTVNANGEKSVVVGHNSTASEKFSTAIGYDANATANSATAIGAHARATDVMGTAIGYNAVSSKQYSTAIGYSTTANGVQSTNVGYSSTVSGNSSTTIGSSNTVTGDYSTAIGFRNSVTGMDSHVVGDNSSATGEYSYAFGTVANATAKEAVAIGHGVVANAEKAIAIGTDAKATVADSVALGSNSVTTSAVSTPSIDINGTTHTFAGGTANGTVSIGTNPDDNAAQLDFKRTITNVAAGRVSDTSTDAVNGSQLNAVVTEVNKNASAIADLNTNAVRQGGKNIRTTITNGERGVELANNLQQLESAFFGNDDDTSSTYITKDMIGVYGENDVHSNITSGAVRTFDGSKNTGVTANGITIENTDNLDQASFTVGGMQASDSNGTVRFTTTNIDAGNQQIHGVKAGVADTDAVNVKQLKDVASSVANTVSGSGAVVVTSSTNSNGSTNYNVTLNTDGIREIAKTSNRYAGDDVIKVNRWNNPTGSADLTTFKFDANEAAKVLPITYKANGENAQTTTASKGLNFVNGNHINASVDNNGVVKFDLDKSVTDRIDSNTNNIKANADAIKKLTVANTANLGGLTDKVNTLSSKVDENQQEARRGIASASALAALHPLDYDPTHKVDVMAGIGHYRGTTAVALGAAYRPNENMMFTVGASINGKDSAINAGVSYKVGAKEGVESKYSKVAMQRHIDELNTTVAEQNEKIEQLNNLVEKLLEEVHQSK